MTTRHRVLVLTAASLGILKALADQGPLVAARDSLAGAQTRLAGAQDTLTMTVAARSVAPGELLVLTLTVPPDANAVIVRIFDREVPAFRIATTLWRAIVGIDLETRGGHYAVSLVARTAGRESHRETSVDVVARRFPTRRLQVEPRFVDPPPEVQQRIAREAKELDAVWAASGTVRLWSDPFVKPVPGASANRFGSRSVFNGQPRNPHSGDDFSGATGTPVLAPNAGHVALARELYFAGNTVIVDHGLGLFSLLAHLSAFDVREGDQVTAGQRVGRVGATGRVTGPHLHWAVRAAGARIDPSSLLAMLGNAPAASEPKPSSGSVR